MMKKTVVECITSISLERKAERLEAIYSGHFFPTVNRASRNVGGPGTLQSCLLKNFFLWGGIELRTLLENIVTRWKILYPAGKCLTPLEINAPCWKMSYPTGK